MSIYIHFHPFPLFRHVTFLFRHSRTRVRPSGGTRAREIRHFRRMPLCTFCNTLFIHQPRLSRATLVLASPNVVAWAHLDTDTIPNNAPANRLRNGYVLVEVCQVLFSTFYPYAHKLSSTYSGSFCVILGSFGHLHTP
jgi:hypothetical protein